MEWEYQKKMGGRTTTNVVNWELHDTMKQTRAKNQTTMTIHYKRKKDTQSTQHTKDIKKRKRRTEKRSPQRKIVNEEENKCKLAVIQKRNIATKSKRTGLDTRKQRKNSHTHKFLDNNIPKNRKVWMNLPLRKHTSSPLNQNLTSSTYLTNINITTSI